MTTNNIKITTEMNTAQLDTNEKIIKDSSISTNYHNQKNTTILEIV